MKYLTKENLIYIGIAAIGFVVLYCLMTDTFNIASHEHVGAKPSDPPAVGDGDASEKKEE